MTTQRELDFNMSLYYTWVCAARLWVIHVTHDSMWGHVGFYSPFPLQWEPQGLRTWLWDHSQQAQLEGPLCQCTVWGVMCNWLAQICQMIYDIPLLVEGEGRGQRLAPWVILVNSVWMMQMWYGVACEAEARGCMLKGIWATSGLQDASSAVSNSFILQRCLQHPHTPFCTKHWLCR